MPFSWKNPGNERVKKDLFCTKMEKKKEFIIYDRSGTQYYLTPTKRRWSYLLLVR